jgi:hypothetical protein
LEVAYLGTSQIHYGVIPELVAQEATRCGRTLGPQFNLGIPGSEFEIGFILARDVLKGPQCPKLAIVGVMPLLVAANDEGNPDLVCRYGNLADIAARVETGEVPAPALAAATFRGVETLLQYPFYSLKKPVRQFRWEQLRQSHGGWWLPGDEASTRPVSKAQWKRFFAEYRKPKPLYFSDESRAARQLCRFRDLAEQRGMRLLVVYTPQHPELMTRKYEAGSEERYHAWMPDFCHRHQISYLDLSDPGQYTPDDFMDPMHVNARGAAKFTRRLAEVVLAELARE